MTYKKSNYIYIYISNFDYMFFTTCAEHVHLVDPLMVTTVLITTMFDDIQCGRPRVREVAVHPNVRVAQIVQIHEVDSNLFIRAAHHGYKHIRIRNRDIREALCRHWHPLTKFT